MKRDYLFVFTEESDNAGDEVLCEANSLEDAYDIMFMYILVTIKKFLCIA